MNALPPSLYKIYYKETETAEQVKMLQLFITVSKVL